MLRKPISGDFSGVVQTASPTLESAHEMSPFSWVCMKKNANSPLSPILPTGSAHGYDLANLRDMFSHALARATSDTSKHEEVHDSGYFIWFYIEHGMSMRCNVICGKEKNATNLYIYI